MKVGDVIDTASNNSLIVSSSMNSEAFREYIESKPGETNARKKTQTRTKVSLVKPVSSEMMLIFLLR
jgi:hypothetical protein